MFWAAPREHALRLRRNKVSKKFSFGITLFAIFEIIDRLSASISRRRLIAPAAMPVIPGLPAGIACKTTAKLLSFHIDFVILHMEMSPKTPLKGGHWPPLKGKT